LTTKLLDTNVCVAIIRGRPREVDRMAVELPICEMRVSAITMFELAYGAAKSANFKDEMAKVTRFVDAGPTVIDVDRADAEAAGALRALLAGKGAPIGGYDLLIAGQALARGWTVVTANTREFVRVPGLTIEDWTAPA
jgi:tRNA(fMet)-specific endonuclease VapC